MGTLNYELVRMALSMFEEAWIDGPLHGEVHVVQHFCERIVGLIDALEKITGHRIANDDGCYGEVPTSGQAVPASLQQLVRKMEASNDTNVATSLARFARAFIDAACSGSMSEKKIGRNIPLREAMQRSMGVLMAAVYAYIERFSAMLNDAETFEGDFDPKKFRSNAHKTFEVSLFLSTQSSIVHQFYNSRTILFSHPTRNSRPWTSLGLPLVSTKKSRWRYSCTRGLGKKDLSKMRSSSL